MDPHFRLVFKVMVVYGGFQCDTHIQRQQRNESNKAFMMKPELFFIFKGSGNKATAAAGVCKVFSPSPVLTGEEAGVMWKIKAEAHKNNKEK